MAKKKTHSHYECGCFNCPKCKSKNTEVEYWDSGATCGPMGSVTLVICKDCGAKSEI